MYETNHLAGVLRESSMGAEDSVFATLPDNHSVTYGALFRNAEKIARVLQDNGVRAGDRVAVQIGKSITAVELYLGTILSGGVFLPLNTDYTPSEIEYFLTDAQPVVFVCDNTKKQNLDGIAKKTGVASVLTLSADGKSGSLASEIADVSDRYHEVTRRPEDLAAILYTSGTTGRSKGAMLSHGALSSNALTLREYWHFTREDCLIHALPIFHIHGLFVAINITLTTGSRMEFLSKFDTNLVFEKLKTSSVLMGVPTFYVRLLKHPGLCAENVSSMRLFVSGSAPLLSETHNQWRDKTGHAILERYGMTETNMNTSNPYKGERKPGTVGFPLPGVEVKICNSDTGEELPDGEIGQIEVRGSNLFSGYWKMPEKTAEELRENGWFLTGDLGKKDEEGYISIVGRSKDLIISGGYNIYPKEIESVIDDIDGVCESAIIGVPHPDFGEAVVAVIVADSSYSGSNPHELSQAIIHKTGSDLAKFKQPKEIFYVDELPRNTMGKVQKAQLRDRYSHIFAVKVS